MLLHLKFKQFLSTIFPILLACAFTAGCQTNPVKEKPPVGQIELARQLFKTGDYTAAAEEFLKLAQDIENSTSELNADGTSSLQKQDYQLSAAEAYIRSGNSLQARKTVVQIDGIPPNNPLLIRYYLIRGRIAELDQQPEQVIEALDQISIDQIIPGIQKDILQMRITAFEALESPLDTARSRCLIDPFLDPLSGNFPDQNENRRAIWAIVDQLELIELNQLHDNQEDPLRAWVQLSLIARQSLFDATAFSENVEQWRLDYPVHAAETPILEELFAKSESLGKKVSSIALLLPQEGRFARAGAAVRDGFLAAWYGENDLADQPMVHVYDANTENILDTYQRALEEGADIIIGPLEKSALKILLSLPELSVRTLALNQLSGEELAQSITHIESDNFYQFGLSPEHEAAQVAEKAWEDGYSHALAITPEGTWGDRLFNAFREKYEELGGVVLEHQQFATSSTNSSKEKTTKPGYSDSVIQLLNIDGSKQRFAALRKELSRKIKFEPRPRKDMDFIFMAASPVQARQIRPQLLFHRASQIPVISTSHAFGLPPRGEPDLDLEGIIIGDMPWMIKNQEIDPEMPLSMQQSWPDDNAAFLRLFALGMDAYIIIPHLGRLRLQAEWKFEGETGQLYMNEDAQIQRKLAWAKFSGGKPRFIDTQQFLPASELFDVTTNESKRSPD